jgi:hypothetical protein
MVNPSVTLTSTAFSGSSTRTVRCQSVQVGLKKNNEVKPIDNGTALAYVQTVSYENPRYSIRGVHFTGETGTLTYADVLALIRLKYGTSSAPTLTVTYGTSSTLVGADGTTTAIKVILDSADFPIDTGDSNRGYLPVATLNFIETK